MAYLNTQGLNTLWTKIKNTFIKQADIVEATEISVDLTPTANSTNLVTSGGVYNAIAAGGGGGSADLSAYRTASAQDVIDSGKVDKVSGKGLSTEDYTTAEKTKLAGVATGATAVNESTVSGWGFTKNTGTLTASSSLDASKLTGTVPQSVLPSYVDDVIEGYLYSGEFYEDSAHTSSKKITGETGKIYIDLSNNKTYRWSGSTFVVISETLAIGTTASTAAAGNHTHSNATTSVDGLMSSSDKSKLDGIASNANNYSHPGSGTNPHGTTKSDVGLGDVGNFKAVSTVASQGLTDTEKSNARANIGVRNIYISTSDPTSSDGENGDIWIVYEV